MKETIAPNHRSGRGLALAVLVSVARQTGPRGAAPTALIQAGNLRHPPIQFQIAARLETRGDQPKENDT